MTLVGVESGLRLPLISPRSVQPQDNSREQQDDSPVLVQNESYKNGQLSEKGTYKDGEPHGPFEGYSKNGQLEWKGAYNMGEECGEWVEDGETVTYDPCPPDH